MTEEQLNKRLSELPSFKDALKILNIEDYSERIFHSNSHGELFHLMEYSELAEVVQKNPVDFRSWFIHNVEFAEKNWERPESIFQHIGKLFWDQIKDELNEKSNI